MRGRSGSSCRFDCLHKFFCGQCNTGAHHNTPHHYALLRYTTLHYTTPHYTTLRCTTLHYTTLHYPALHYTTLHYTTVLCSTPHYTTAVVARSINIKNHSCQNALSGHTIPLPCPSVRCSVPAHLLLSEHSPCSMTSDQRPNRPQPLVASDAYLVGENPTCSVPAL